MINKANQFKFLTLIALVAGFVWGSVQAVNAQQGDPFAKPAWTKPKPPAPPPGQNPTATTAPANKNGSAKTPAGKPLPPVPPPVVPMTAPLAQDRINWFKEIRRIAAEKGEPLPKVTSVLTLSEMSVSGIFKTPRGYAAIVQSSVLPFANTIYPGEKFFDGQLVAIEENRLIFKKVVKMSNGKFVSSEEVKPLRTYSEQEELQGTAPVDASASKGEAKATDTASASGQPADPNKPVQPVVIISPLEEMNRQPVETPKSAKEKANEKGKKGKSSEKNQKSSAAKKSTKVATAKKPAKAEGSKEQ